MVSIGGKTYASLIEAVECAKPGDTLSVSGSHEAQCLIISAKLKGLLLVRMLSISALV